MSQHPMNRSRWVTASVAAAVLVSAGVPAALAASRPAPGSSTTKASPSALTDGPGQPPNVDKVKIQVEAYYGDPNKTGVATANSGYGHDSRGVAAKIASLLKARQHWSYGTSKKTLLLDVDDTTLLTYNYEIFSNFAYNPTTNGDFVTGEKFPSVFGMVAMVKAAKAEGYAVIYLTGRPNTQQAATVGNLEKVGYPAPDAIYTKPTQAPYPSYLTCAPTCTTVEYKSSTRKHIQDDGNHIVANAGDQYSDLAGGYADMTFKLPNPMYFLP